VRFLFLYSKTLDRSVQLLSVQVALTPGLHPGPGIYAGDPASIRSFMVCRQMYCMSNFHIFLHMQYKKSKWPSLVLF